MNTPFFTIAPQAAALGEEAMKLCQPYFERTDEITEYHQHKMLRAFQNARVSESCAAISTLASIPASRIARRICFLLRRFRSSLLMPFVSISHFSLASISDLFFHC